MNNNILSREEVALLMSDFGYELDDDHPMQLIKKVWPGSSHFIVSKLESGQYQVQKHFDDSKLSDDEKNSFHKFPDFQKLIEHLKD